MLPFHIFYSRFFYQFFNLILTFDNLSVIIQRSDEMFNIIFYKNKRDISEVKNFLINLQSKNDKNSRIQVSKIIAYINMLSKYGTTLGEPYIKHLKDEIWELRPMRNRILFAYMNNNNIVLLNVFMKQKTKTPQKEILKAKKYLKDFIKRSDKNEQ